MSVSVRRSRALKSLVTGLVFTAAVAAVSSPATAGAPSGSIWGSPSDDRECVDVDPGLLPVPTLVSMELITSLRPLDDGDLVFPSATVNRSSGRITVNVPEEFYTNEYDDWIGEEGPFAFYLMSVEFVDDCTDDPLVPRAFDACFDSTPPIFWELPVSDSMTFLFFLLPEGSSTVTIDITTAPCGGEPEPEPDTYEELILLEEILDNLNIDGEGLIDPVFGDFDSIDLNHYLRMAEAQENALPNTR